MTFQEVPKLAAILTWYQFVFNGSRWGRNFSRYTDRRRNHPAAFAFYRGSHELSEATQTSRAKFSLVKISSEQLYHRRSHITGGSDEVFAVRFANRSTYELPNVFEMVPCSYSWILLAPVYSFPKWEHILKMRGDSRMTDMQIEKTCNHVRLTIIGAIKEFAKISATNAYQRRYVVSFELHTANGKGFLGTSN